MSPLWTLLSSLLLAGLADGRMPFPGICPRLPTVENFKLKLFLGKWFQSEQYPTATERSLSCIYSVYRQSSEASDEISFTDKAFGSDRKSLSVTGTMYPVLGKHSTAVPNFQVRYDKFSALNKNVSTLKVVATDYSSHALLWHCEPSHDKALAHKVHFRWLYILTRSRLQDKTTNNTIDQVLKSINISRGDLTSTDQKNCGRGIHDLFQIVSNPIDSKRAVASLKNGFRKVDIMSVVSDTAGAWRKKSRTNIFWGK